MAAKRSSAAMPQDLLSRCLEHAPWPMAAVEGARHIVRSVNPAFCRLIDKTADELKGKPFGEMLPEQKECLALLDRVYRTGKFTSHAEPDEAAPRPVFSSYTMWPVTADERTTGVVIQVIYPTILHEKTLAMNEALMLGSLRQHELAASAHSANIQLQTEIGERKQSERDALTLTSEVSHRIKNSLQIVVALIAYEARSISAPYAQGYEAMQARIGAIAELYDLISQSSSGRTVPVDAYLGAIAKAMSASLLGNDSGIKIEVEAEAFDIDHKRAVPFGLLVNELATNAIKHAFPEGAGRVVLRVEQIGDEIELTVADNGVGTKDNDSAKTPAKHGSDYISIFVRQLSGTITVSESEATGTTVRIRLPSLVVPRAGAEPGAV